MDEDSAEVERKRRIDEIDQRVAAPEVRADRIWKILREHAPDKTNWDVLCFAVEFIGMLVPEYPWLEDVAKPLVSRVYTAHYVKEGLYDGWQYARRDESPAQLEHRRADMGGESKTDSTRIVLPSGIFGRSTKESSAGLHLSDNREVSTENGGEETTRSDERRDSGGDAG